MMEPFQVIYNHQITVLDSKNKQIYGTLKGTPTKKVIKELLIVIFEKYHVQYLLIKRIRDKYPLLCWSNSSVETLNIFQLAEYSASEKMKHKKPEIKVRRCKKTELEDISGFYKRKELELYLYFKCGGAAKKYAKRI